MVINEAVSSNALFEDEDGDSEDWLELYNNGEMPVSLEGWSLTDDPMEPQKWVIPAMTLGAGEYLLIWASDKDRVDPNAALHTNFKISSSGETLQLYTATGALKHSLDVSGLKGGTSIGLSKVDQATVFYNTPTPGEINDINQFAGVIQETITFSSIGGVNSTAMVMLEGASEGQQIRYTLDASIPYSNSAVYDGAILTPENTVIRARVYADDYIPSAIQSRTFLANAAHDIAVVTLETDPLNFFDMDFGIYVLGDEYERAAPHYGANFWEDWERDIHFSFYEPDGTLGIEFDAGVKIFGGYTRSSSQKSLAFYSRTRYGTEKFEYPFFPELSYDKFNNLVLRNSGNDWQNTMLRDRAFTSLMAGTEVDYQAGRPVAVYLNGEYWGLHNLREKVNEHMLARKHKDLDIDKNDINLLEFEGVAIEGSNESYLSLLEYVTTTDPTAEGFFETVAAQIDIENYIAYQSLQIYIANTDWPIRNIKYWNSPSTRWRWVLYDTDFGFSLYQDTVDLNSFQYATGTLPETTDGGWWGSDWDSDWGSDWGNGGANRTDNPEAWSTELFGALMQNPEFQQRFIAFFVDQLNSRFLPDNIEAHIQTLADEIATEMPRQQERWGGNFNWQSNIDRLITYGKQRPAHLWQYLTAFFELEDPITLSVKGLDTDAGYVTINTVTVDSENWTGQYYAELPVTVTAVAKKGYEFSGWSGDTEATTASLTLNLSAATDLTPVFVASDL